VKHQPQRGRSCEHEELHGDSGNQIVFVKQKETMQQNKLFSGLAAVLISVMLGTRTGRAAETGKPATLPAAIRADAIVAADGTTAYKSVQEAISAAPNGGTQRFVIHIKPGTYKEKLTVPGSKCPITFQGEDAATTILTLDDAAKTMRDGKEVGTSGSATLLILAPEFQAENITFENSAGATAGQAVAVNVWSDRAIFRKCRFLGWQDTLLVNRNRQYFEDCTIAGHVDFIFGGSTAWFERCELNCRLGGSITAASTPQEQAYGMVFSHCKITTAPLAERTTAGRLTTILGRTWRPYASVIFLNTEMANVVTSAAWDNWGKAENEKTARYAEFNSRTPDGEPLDVSMRAPWAKQLTAAEAATITPQKVFGDWNPPVTPNL
jgi:pectinesterase